MHTTSEIALKDLPALAVQALGLVALGFCFLLVAFCV
jgi:hypothetical protein